MHESAVEPWRQRKCAGRIAEIDTPLLAQIVSTDDADISFVDEGSLYSFATANDGYEVVLQYY